jgi:predicted lipoprotein with Yx(FWY)xxD motif
MTHVKQGRVSLFVVLMAVLASIGYVASTGTIALGASSSGSTVSLHKTSLGTVLATSNGHTLYLFAKDKVGKSTCSGQCAKYWPPLVSKTKPTAGAGVKASLLGRVARANGQMQVTYNHHPLYTFLPDKAAGDVNGQGSSAFGAKWWALSAKGTAVTTMTGTTTSETTTGSTTTAYQPPPPPGY